MTFVNNLQVGCCVAVLSVVFLCGCTVTAQTSHSSLPHIESEGVSAESQLAPGVGYAVVQGRLIWTNDNGGMWTDITPPEPANQAMQILYFLDTSHAWVVFFDGSGIWNSNVPVRLVSTMDGGRGWRPLLFDTSSYVGLRETIATPVALSFADAEHGWFLWRIQTSSAFSVGRLFSTDDGGLNWTELPDPPAATGFEFHTPQEGWMAGGASGSELWTSHDGGRSWKPRTVPTPVNCKQCRPEFDTPKFQTPNDAAMNVTFSDDTISQGRYVNSTYVTHDGGDSWQVAEAFEQSEPYPRTGIASISDMHVVRVFSTALRGVQVRSDVGAINSSYPKEFSGRGLIVGANFVDNLNGWLLYNTTSCAKRRNPATDGPGLPCLKIIQKNELLATMDGGKTFTVITPTVSPATTK